jgi:hypothetical protein
VATLYSAAEPDSLRGPQHSHAWCDEIAKWDNSASRAELAWDNMLMGLRLGEKPQAMATTTPRAVPLLTRLLKDEDAIVTRGRTKDNRANLPERFIRETRASLGSALLARQELDGEMLLDHAGALWTRALIESCREAFPAAPPARMVVGVDPPASAEGDACGIVVVALGQDGIARVLADASVTRPSPNAGPAPSPKPPRCGTPTAWWPRPIRAAPWWKACCAPPASPCPCGWCMPHAARAPAPSPSPRSTKQAGCAIAANSPRWRMSCAASSPGAPIRGRPLARPGRCRRLGADRTDAAPARPARARPLTPFSKGETDELAAIPRRRLQGRRAPRALARPYGSPWFLPELGRDRRQPPAL